MSRILLAGLCLSLALPSLAHATTVQYFDDDELFDMADIVMLGIVWSRDVHREVPASTDYEIETVECFKGCKPREFITMHLLGAPPDDLRPTDEWFMGMPAPKNGSRVIIYLKRVVNDWLTPISLGLGHYTLFYHAQQKRYIAHRDVEELAIMKPATPGRESEDVLVPRDRIATEVLNEIRTTAAKRSRR